MTEEKTRRPWGTYRVIKTGLGYKVKVIEVFPGKRLSLQSHKFRSEHWTIVSGVGRITRGNKTFDLKANQGTYIPANTLHRLANPKKNAKLRMVEVQCGSYTGEDDIKRYDDDFGRAKKASKSKKR